MVQESSQTRTPHPWYRWQMEEQTKKVGEREDTQTRFLFRQVSGCCHKTFLLRSHWTRSQSHGHAQLQGRLENAVFIPGGQINAHSESEVLVLWRKGSVGIVTQLFLSQYETFASEVVQCTERSHPDPLRMQRHPFIRQMTVTLQRPIEIKPISCIWHLKYL